MYTRPFFSQRDQQRGVQRPSQAPTNSSYPYTMSEFERIHHPHYTGLVDTHVTTQARQYDACQHQTLIHSSYQHVMYEFGMHPYTGLINTNITTQARQPHAQSQHQIPIPSSHSYTMYQYESMHPGYTGLVDANVTAQARQPDAENEFHGYESESVDHLQVDTNTLHESTEQDPVYITRKFNRDLMQFSSDSEKLNFFIKNVSRQSINIMAKAIVAKIKKSNGINIGKKIDELTIIELLILARRYNTHKELYQVTPIKRELIVGRLAKIGLSWQDLVMVNVEPIEKLSNLYHQKWENETSCLNETLSSCIACRDQNFSFEENLNELIVEFANTGQPFYEIARKFYIDIKFLTRNFFKIIELLKEKYEFSTEVENKLSGLKNLNKVRYLCALIKNNDKNDSIFPKSQSIVIRERANTQSDCKEDGNLLKEDLLIFARDNDEIAYTYQVFSDDEDAAKKDEDLQESLAWLLEPVTTNEQHTSSHESRFFRQAMQSPKRTVNDDMLSATTTKKHKLA